MSNLPFVYIAVPVFFKEAGYEESFNACKFTKWTFGECRNKKRKVIYRPYEVELGPFEFICCPSEHHDDADLTYEQMRYQIRLFIQRGLLIKTDKGVRNKFTVYRWNMPLILKLTKQKRINHEINPPTPQPQIHDPRDFSQGKSQFHRHFTNKDNTDTRPAFQPIYPEKSAQIHQPNVAIPTQEIEFSQTLSQTPNIYSIDNKNHPYPSLNPDDSSFEKSYQKPPPIEVYPGISISKADFDACVAIKGSPEIVKAAVKEIQENPKRLRVIKDWVNALKNWSSTSSSKALLQENEAIARDVIRLYGNDYKAGNGFMLEKGKDPRTGEKILIFVQENANVAPTFLKLTDKSFKEKLREALIIKKIANRHAIMF